MGLANSVAEKMGEKQREMQQEMAAKQLANMLKGQEEMRKKMLAQQIAITRERLWWLGGVWAAFTTLGCVATLKKGFGATKVGLIPWSLYTTMVLYQADFAYGTKPNRIRHIMEEEVLRDPNYWFVSGPTTETSSSNNNKK
ncbi:hypothetical protein QOT17_015519 [Balamuthia mandrillaris]